MKKPRSSTTHELNIAKARFGPLSRSATSALKKLLVEHDVSVISGDLTYLRNGWYITHAGLLRLAQRRHCSGIHTRPVLSSSDPVKDRWVFRAAVFKSPGCKGFVGYGDAAPSNVSDLVRGAEMRVAETRAVNRALRKAYGIGICSVEELGSSAEPTQLPRESKRLPAQPVSGNGYGGPKVRDRLCQVIRQHQLDPTLVKSYATEFCGVKSLRDASREQVETFVAHLADWAEKDRNALLCQLNSYLGQKEGAA
jgi:hypothetical protein